MYNMHLIINTHWDREYRWSFSETQFRLGEAVDDLIDIMKKDKKFAYFHTDSQASMLEDYLEIRPERTEELKQLVKEGRILTGPWYTLPAEFLVSGEALVRNLLMGHQIAEKLGKVMKAAYNIFSWGQVSQLPQIYKQFGMDSIIFYRGIDQSSLDTLEFKWRSPDGTEALGITFGSYHRLNFWRYVYLPYILGNNSVSGDNHKISRDNLGDKGFFFNLCDIKSDDINHQIINQPCARDLKGALDGMKILLDTVKDKSSVNELLFLQGFDQENPDPIISELIDEINKNIDYGHLQVSSFPEYMEKVKKIIYDEKIIDKLPVREGEMLEVEKVGDAFGPLYNGVFSARMPIKLMNSECQYLLENWAEPAAAWSMICGGSYPQIPLKNAWKEVLKNQQHDGIGGCHVDRVTKTMVERYDVAKDIAETVIKTSLKDLTCKIDFSNLKKQEIGLVVFNSSQFVRSDVLTVTIDIPLEWGYRINGNYRKGFSINVADSTGNKVASQLLSMEDDAMYGYLKFGNVIGFDATRCIIAMEVKEVPAMGYATYIISPDRAKQRPVEVLSPEVNTLENEFIRATINPNGSITMIDKTSGKKFENLHYFEDTGDKGGPLIWDTLYEKGIFNTLSQQPDVSLVYNGPIYAKYRITYEWHLPEGLSTELKVHVPHGSEWIDQGRVKRSEKKRIVTIDSEVVLKKGSNKLEFNTTVNNTVCDHRLRVMFPTGISTAEFCYADSPFDVVKRPIKVPDSTGWYEEAARTWPSNSLIAVSDGEAQVAVMHHGISEYEVTDNMSRTIALTLIRAFGTAGNPTETHRYQELAQCLGKHVFSYSIYAGEQKYDTAELVKNSVLFNVPLRAAQTTKHEGEFGAQKSFFKLSSDKFIITAVKKAEKEDAMLIRGYNASEQNEEITISCDFDIETADKVTLEEISQQAISIIDKRTFKFEAGKKEIVSIMVKC